MRHKTLEERVSALERKLNSLKIMSAAAAELCLRDENSPSMLYAFVAKLNGILEYTE